MKNKEEKEANHWIRLFYFRVGLRCATLRDGGDGCGNVRGQCAKRGIIEVPIGIGFSGITNRNVRAAHDIAAC